MSMDLQASIEQVAGILVREELEYETHPDGDAYRVLFGSAAVFVGFDNWRGSVRILLTSPILQEIDEEGPGAALALNQLNAFNLECPFLKFVFTDGKLLAVYDLLGDNLHSGELLNALHTMGNAADRLGEELAEELGGEVWENVLED